MAKKFDAHGAAARAWSLALLGMAVTLFVVSALLLWSPYDRRQADLREPGVSDRETVAGQDFAAQSASPSLPGEGRPDASSGGIRQTTHEGVIELEFQPVAGRLREPAVNDPLADDPVYRPARRDAGSGGGGNGGAGNGSGGDAGRNGEDAGAESVVVRNPAVGGAGAAGEPAPTVPAPPALEPCGMVDCPFGTVCCNPSCGLCAPPDGTCSRLSCSMPTFPISVSCGRNTCNAGEVCCNLSCGICTGPGETCSQRVCD
jgi:hypothetical protein